MELPYITAEMGSDDTSVNVYATGFGLRDIEADRYIVTPVEGCTAEITLNEENGVHVVDITVAKVAAELSRSAIQALMSFPIISSTARAPNTTTKAQTHHAQDQGTRHGRNRILMRGKVNVFVSLYPFFKASNGGCHRGDSGQFGMERTW